MTRLEGELQGFFHLPINKEDIQQPGHLCVEHTNTHTCSHTHTRVHTFRNITKPLNTEAVTRLIKTVTVASKLTFCPNLYSQVGNFGVQSTLGEAIYVCPSDKQDYRLSLMSIDQRLFNDFSQISVVGVAEIIALGLAAD